MLGRLKEVGGTGGGFILTFIWSLAFRILIISFFMLFELLTRAFVLCMCDNYHFFVLLVALLAGDCVTSVVVVKSSTVQTTFR